MASGHTLTGLRPRKQACVSQGKSLNVKHANFHLALSPDIPYKKLFVTLDVFDLQQIFADPKAENGGM